MVQTTYETVLYPYILDEMLIYIIDNHNAIVIMFKLFNTELMVDDYDK